jgi:hypothetical protein
MEHGLGIGRTPEAMALCKKALSEGGVVIKLAVVGDPACSVLIRHGLGTGGGEIDNGKPTMAEPEGTINMEAFGVWPAVSQNPSHTDQQIAIYRAIWFCVMENPNYAAHST